MATRKRSHEPLSIDAAVASAAERARSSGACPLTALGVPKANRLEVVARLREQGFEITKSNVRQPLAAQLRAALATGAFLGLKVLKAHVVAATAAEAKAAALELVRAGDAHLVLRAGVPTLVPVDVDVLGAEELGRMARGLDAALKQIRKAARAKAKLLREDVTAAIVPLIRSSPAGIGSVGSGSAGRGPAGRGPAGSGPAGSGPAGSGPAGSGPAGSGPAGRGPAERRAVPSSLAERVLPAVAAATEPRIGLAFVPTVVRSLSEGASVAQALEALREAAQRGLIELRPESGLGRISGDERLLCVPGPEGTLLSWARLREETDL